MRTVLIIVAIAMGVFLYTLDKVSHQYWEAVGPKVNKSLNPDTHDQ